MTWRRAFGREPISPQSEQSGFARVVLAAEVEPAVAATPTSGQMVSAASVHCVLPGR